MSIDSVRAVKYVLFVCTHNAGRSQMAQAFFERHAPEGFRAESAGTTPASAVHPEVVTAMREVGIDLEGRRPRRLLLEMQLHADWAVTMGCGDACPYVPTRIEDWDLPDPAGRDIWDVRDIRDEIDRRVRDLVENRLQEILSDRTAHELRLARLLPPLVAEFEGLRTPQEIRACADAILAAYDDVPVRSFVQAIADRRARECLKHDVCEPLLSA